MSAWLVLPSFGEVDADLKVELTVMFVCVNGATFEVCGLDVDGPLPIYTSLVSVCHGT